MKKKLKMLLLVELGVLGAIVCSYAIIYSDLLCKQTIIILALLFVFVDLGGFVDFITAKTVTAKEVWTIFVFMLFVVFSVLRILKAIIEWLKKDGTSNKSIPRTTVLLTLLGTILGLLLKK